MKLFNIFLIVLSILFTLSFGSNLKVIANKLNVNDANVVEEAKYALSELQKLSDSRVYSSLSLTKIISASSESGIYHDNMMLELELSSLYFVSGKLEEKFNMIIMKHKEDGTKSFAIDEFPEMKESAIESFWIDKVKEKVKLKEISFRRLEIEALFNNNNSNCDVNNVCNNNNDIKEILDKKSVEEILITLDSDDLLNNRIKLSKKFQLQLINDQLKEEIELMNLSLSELYLITIDEGNIINKPTEFQIYRAKEFVDFCFTILHNNK